VGKYTKAKPEEPWTFADWLFRRTVDMIVLGLALSVAWFTLAAGVQP